MKKLALIITTAMIMIITPASAAATPRADCVVAAAHAQDVAAVTACLESGASTNRIDWD